MDTFVTWDMFAVFGTLSSMVYMVTEFTKETKLVRWIPTKYYSWFIAFGLICISSGIVGTFRPIDIVLYAISAIAVSLSSNGLFDFNNKK